MAAATKRHVLITGPPGVGKTTLIKKICEELNRRHVTATGFYTEELREHGQRIGFDVVSLSGDRGPLARIGTSASQFFVGKYNVDVKSFESISLPSMKQQCENCVLILDEIGKMEVFSKPFQSAIQEIFHSNRNPVLATIPIARGKPLPLVDNIRKRQDVQLFTVTIENRDHLTSSIIEVFSKK